MSRRRVQVPGMAAALAADREAALRRRAGRCATKAGRGAAEERIDRLIKMFPVDGGLDDSTPAQIRDRARRIARIADQLDAADALARHDDGWPA